MVPDHALKSPNNITSSETLVDSVISRSISSNKSIFEYLEFSRGTYTDPNSTLLPNKCFLTYIGEYFHYLTLIFLYFCSSAF